jgi:hypothetical protein
MSEFVTDEVLEKTGKFRQQTGETIEESLARHRREILRQQRLKDHDQKTKKKIKKHKREEKGATKIHWTEYEIKRRVGVKYHKRGRSPVKKHTRNYPRRKKKM